MKKIVSLLAPAVVCGLVAFPFAVTRAQDGVKIDDLVIKPVVMYNQGAVTVIDAKNLTLEVQTTPKNKHAYKLTRDTLIAKDKLPQRPVDIAVRNFVQVTYVKEGDSLVTQRVYVYEAAPQSEHVRTRDS